MDDYRRYDDDESKTVAARLIIHVQNVVLSDQIIKLYAWEHSNKKVTFLIYKFLCYEHFRSLKLPLSYFSMAHT